MRDVVDWGLCVGCGACYAYCDKDAVSLRNIESIGIRPIFTEPACSECNECLDICPGLKTDGALATGALPVKSDGDIDFGPYLEIWQGYATDPEIRFKGSSGALISALALYCIENENIDKIIHTGMDSEVPWLNKTYHSRTRDELLSRAGSRYAPASPCEGLRDIEHSEGTCVFIGKPCDTAGTMMLTDKRKAVDDIVGLVLSFFCAGTPSTSATLNLMNELGIAPEETISLRYRGEGWPGEFRAISKDHTERSLTYMESWGKLNKHRPFRCQLCPDGLGRLADISCGDAWHLFPDEGNIGSSIVIVRTEKGREILHKAINANYVSLERISEKEVLKAQDNLLSKRRQIYGRLIAMRMFGIPTPQFTNFSLAGSWIRLSLIVKIRSILGTVKRIVLRKLYKKQRTS